MLGCARVVRLSASGGSLKQVFKFCEAFLHFCLSVCLSVILSVHPVPKEGCERGLCARVVRTGSSQHKTLRLCGGVPRVVHLEQHNHSGLCARAFYELHNRSGCADCFKTDFCSSETYSIY